MFKINGNDYEVEQAYMDALLDDEEEGKLYLGLEIECRRVDDGTLPVVTSDTLLIINKNEIKEWQDIAGRAVEWERCSKDIWKPHLKFVNCYKNSFRESFMRDTKVEFEGAGDKILVRIRGLCDSKFNGKEMRTLSLEIEVEVDFRWVQTGRHESEEAARNRLDPYLDSKNYVYTVSKPDASVNSSGSMGRFDLKK